jgi:NADH:ubiquinone oxidoreductase subunit 5 (subunit L)/multisubunit Na+/H+ antiporter MnhA subunit
VAILGLAGGLLHIWNHSLMKGLMFLSAGSVLHGTGTKDLERLGGLMKRMPRTGVAMTLGALAIAAVPPLNGFVSEWLIYMAMLRGGLEFTGVSRTALLLAVGVLALIGGLASICFVRLIGIVLLGESRSSEARHAHESSGWMTAPLGVLAVFCVVAGMFPRALVSIFSQTVEQVFGISAGDFTATLNSPQSPLAILGMLNVIVWSALILGALILLVLHKNSRAVADATWGCGYVAPTTRMQYTGQSFAELMVTRLFPKSLRPKTSIVAPQGLFPSDGKLATEYPDPLSCGVYQPFFERWAERFAQLRWVQQGKLHYYLLYFVVVLVVALAWVVFRGWVMP